jgi:hypothetical protein
MPEVVIRAPRESAQKIVLSDSSTQTGADR